MQPSHAEPPTGSGGRKYYLEGLRAVAGLTRTGSGGVCGRGAGCGAAAVGYGSGAKQDGGTMVLLPLPAAAKLVWEGVKPCYFWLSATCAPHTSVFAL